MKTLKQKFDSIDQRKISDTQKAFLDKVKDVTENFKSEDKEVNDKVETALDKMIETFKEKMPEALKGNSSGQPKKRNAMSVAKEIRKEGESFTEAKKRASKKIADDKADAKQTIKSELDKLNTFIKSRKKLANIKGTDLLIDSKRKALPKGKRISKNTGKVYYEYRDSKTDRLSPNYPKNAPYLAGGGGVDVTENINLGNNFVLEITKAYYTNGNFTYVAHLLYKNYTFKYFSGGINDTREEAIKNVRNYLKTLSVSDKIIELTRVVSKTPYEYRVIYTDRGGEHLKSADTKKEIEEFIKDVNSLTSKKFELGGSVVTDLAGHQDGTFGLGNHGMLDGFSNTSYSGLVGETGAMSSGELFMAGGSVGMANQQVIDDASQSYVNYYLGEGASAGMFKNGGAIKNQYAGRTPEDIWDSLSVEQRKHFLLDHYYINEEEFEQLQYKRLDAEDKEIIDYYANRTWKKLSGNVRKAFTSHVKEGQYARGGGVRKVGNREYSYGRNWTNDHRHINQSENHEVKYTRKGKFLGIFNSGGALKNERKHVNHSEDYEIRYAKPRPSRKGYKGARKFMAGGVNNETPKIYVANLEAYNNGKLEGIWLDLGDYDDARELMKEINNFIKNSGGEEFAIHDTENIPSSFDLEYAGEGHFEELYNIMELAKDNNLPIEVVIEVVNDYGESAVEEFYGKYDNAEDFAEQIVDELGGLENFSSPEYYVDITETDRRLLAQEMADNYADDIKYEDEGRRLIEEGGLDLDEFEEADDDRKEEMLDEARENVYDEYYDNWYQGLSDPYEFLVEEQGMYSPEDFFNASFIRIDYEKLARDLEQDYTFVYSDGYLYVFNVR